MRTGIQNEPWRIFRSMLRPKLCHTSATSNVCVIQNARCRHTLYFGENKRSFVLEASILPDFYYKVRIKYAILVLFCINKTNGHFLRRITQKSAQFSRGRMVALFLKIPTLSDQLKKGSVQLLPFHCNVKEEIKMSFSFLEIYSIELFTLNEKLWNTHSNQPSTCSWYYPLFSLFAVQNRTVVIKIIM